MKYSFYGWQTATITDSNGLTPRNYYDLLSGIWCVDTCAPRMRAEWTPKNRTLGQCSITAFLIQDIFGGLTEEIHHEIPDRLYPDRRRDAGDVAVNHSDMENGRK